jgi:hypothetical protein
MRLRPVMSTFARLLRLGRSGDHNVGDRKAHVNMTWRTRARGTKKLMIETPGREV